MSKIIIEKKEMVKILDNRLYDLVYPTSRFRDSKHLKDALNEIMKDLEPYRIKERCEVM